jgi:allantoin racemase
MKITVIAPIQAPKHKEEETDERDSVRKEYQNKKCCTDLPAQFEFVFIEEGPKLLLNAYDQTYAAPGVVKQAIQAEQNGADAIVINCTADTALRACREAVTIPVFGPTESTMLYAAQFTDQFTVLTFSDRINGRFYRIAGELGLSARLTCSKTVKLSEHSDKGAGDVINALFDAISDINNNTLCDGFMLGCSDFEGMGYMLGCPGVVGVEEGLKKKLLEAGLDIILYKPFEIAIYQAYISVLMNMKSGRISYPRPLEYFT